LAEMAGEPGNLLDVRSLCLRREVTDPHILYADIGIKDIMPQHGL
jgi:hypothetical protein